MSVTNDFSNIAKTREVSFGKQYCLIFKRFMLYAIRTPISVVSFAFMAVFQGILQGSIFHGVGAEKFIIDKDTDIQIVSNMIGLAFLATSDQFLTPAFG